MNRELLEKPFGTDQIKQREGNFGKTLDYIEGHEAISFEKGLSGLRNLCISGIHNLPP